MCITIIIFLPYPKIEGATVETSSLVVITLGMRVDQAHCEMIQAKCLKRDIFSWDTGKFSRIELVLAGCVG